MAITFSTHSTKSGPRAIQVMPDEPNAKPFKDVSSKLNAPSRKSVFERQRAEAEAKRLKEQQETAAVYDDFVKSFDHEASDEDRSLPQTKHAPGYPAGSSGAPSVRRHFSNITTGAKVTKLSGPGTLGPPPASFAKKRSYDGSAPRQATWPFGEEARSATTGAAFNSGGDEDDQTQSREDERAAQRPTIRMLSMPPDVSPTAIKHLIPTTVTVESVRILPPTNTTTPQRRSTSAIVTLASETPASELDSVVTQLQSRYLGRGYYLSLSRHLSSALADSSLLAGAQTTLPFDAKPLPAPAVHGASQMHTMRGARGGIPPPPSLAHPTYASPGRVNTPVRVAVSPPSDLKQLKLIHKMVELVTLDGRDFEALLMTRPDVRNEERWSWLWDPNCVGAKWYRWRLWEVLTRRVDSKDDKRRRMNGYTQQLFDRSAPWVLDESNPPFEFVVELDQFVSDPDYASTEDEDSDDEERRRLQQDRRRLMPRLPGAASADSNEVSYLNPLRKAKLMHLLVLVPETNARLRRGDVARVTSFVIQHAGEGAEEVVEVLTSNVIQPFALQFAGKPGSGPTNSLAEARDSVEQKELGAEEVDPASAKLVGLYLISDILSSSSTSGVRHAWRYRQLFEQALRKKRVFEHLGHLEKRLGWGRLKAEKWRRAVLGMLHLWEGWSVFTAKAQEDFFDAFNNPPTTSNQTSVAEQAEKDAGTSSSVARRWRQVTGQSQEREMAHKEDPSVGVDEMDMSEDLDGEPMAEDEEGDLDGMSMPEDGAEDRLKAPLDVQADETATTVQRPNATEEADPAPAVYHSGDSDRPSTGRRARPRAVDMFGDSDNSDKEVQV